MGFLGEIIMKKINLTEEQMSRIIKNSIRKTLREGAFYADDEGAWMQVRNNYDAETILGELEHWLSNDELNEFAEDFLNTME